MQRTRFDQMTCPIARSLEHVGEWWSMLILRDAFAGLTRFDEFQRNLGIAPNMLTRRLAALVESGMLERRRYSERPPRDEYLLTERGRDFRTVLMTLLAFGNRHFAPEGETVRIVEAATGRPAEPILVDRVSGRPLAEPEFRIVRSPRRNSPHPRIEFGAGSEVAAKRPSKDAPPSRVLRGSTSGRASRQEGGGEIRFPGSQDRAAKGKP